MTKKTKKKPNSISFAIVAISVIFARIPSPARGANKVTFNPAGNMVMNGTATFPISVAMPPPIDGKTPDGKNGYDELRDGGVTCFRIAPPAKWDAAGDAHVKSYLDAAHEHGLYAWVSLRDLDKMRGPEQEKTLHRVIAEFKDHPAICAWKGNDEPAWGKVPPPSIIGVYKIIKQLAPDLPVAVLHAPKLSGAVLVPYMAGCDLTGEDIFPVGYPMGKHSDLPNKELSVVGDETDKIVKAAGGKPVWMTLQIAWSGMCRPGRNTQRFPTFEQERYMTYAAIIHGARGLNYFGGTIDTVLTDEDKKLGWNWRFWNRVLRDVIAEINDKSPLHPALLVENSRLPIKLDGGADGGADDIDFCAREVGDELFLLAAKREGATSQVTFHLGLPLRGGKGAVLFEDPRTVEIKNANDGTFTDWFAPHDVHVYRFSKDASK